MFADSESSRITRRRALVITLLGTILLSSSLAFAQKPEYEFYYGQDVAEPEISRRLHLLRTQHSDLEADFYSRLDGKEGSSSVSAACQ